MKNSPSLLIERQKERKKNGANLFIQIMCIKINTFLVVLQETVFLGDNC